MTKSLKALTLIGTLKPSPARSSSDKIAHDIDAELQKYGVENTFIRLVDYTITPGVETDMGGDDQWPEIREKLLDVDILIISTPTWVGQMSSETLRVLERLDAELSETNDQGLPSMFGKVATVAVVGNEDGAHKISADLFQGLNDIGFTLPAQAVTYWNDQAMGSIDYQDLDEVPENTASATETLARNAVHLAELLKDAPYKS